MKSSIFAPLYKLITVAILSLLTLWVVIYLTSTYQKTDIPTLSPNQLNEQGGRFIIDEESRIYFDTNPSFPELSEYLRDLSEARGAVYALNTLIHGVLPPNIDTHLMGHFVARTLYKELGVDGLAHCTDDLGFACAHAIVIEALFERGDEVFEEINDICSQVVGKGAYSMCFHGFGHGVLAYTGYELPEAIKLCERVGTESFEYYEATECVGGAIMEMRGGIHDPELWEKNGKKYLTEKFPHHMCFADYIDKKYRYICLIYLTPFIFDSQGAQDIPTFEEYGHAIRYCEVLTDPNYREACFGGFAKEFVGFLFGRDVRKIEHITDSQIQQVISACELATAEDGIAACIKFTILDLLGNGKYGFEIAGKVCQLVPTQIYSYCVDSYIAAVNEQNELNPEQREAFCIYTREVFDKNCQSAD